jgi:predicted nucleic acid-binding protein
MTFCPRVVIDTNILISALVFGGKISRLRFDWQEGCFTPLVSKVTTTELMRVLAYPKLAKIAQRAKKVKVRFKPLLVMLLG